ncbi:MAG TPA: secondary thiamine-phosphate synthase enzyme YjbQ [Nitrososphaerales archaeon]|nr:secondary thiamine-phosphate synthase enzyme YjbQ [Nitrososphaerales archaeon]
MIETRIIEIKTSGKDDIANITQDVQNMISGSKLKEGCAILFVQSTTSSLTIIEYEEGLLSDIPRALERIAPKSPDYAHERAWHDGNGHSHVRAAIIGPNLTVPFKEGKLMLGTWQQIVLCEFDVRPRRRTIIVQLLTG